MIKKYLISAPVIALILSGCNSGANDLNPKTIQNKVVTQEATHTIESSNTIVGSAKGMICLYNSTVESLKLRYPGQDYLKLEPFGSYCKVVNNQETVEFLDSHNKSFSMEVKIPSTSSELYELNSTTMNDGNHVVDSWWGGGDKVRLLTIRDQTKSLPYDVSQWMKYLDDNLTLNQIIMPGSHDAGIYKAKGIFGSGQWFNTQNYSIAGQLLSGSRYFDIRPIIGDHLGRLYTYHGSKSGQGQIIISNPNAATDTFVDIGSVVSDSLRFVKNYPSEFLILKISHAQDDMAARRFLEHMERVMQQAKTHAPNSFYVTTDKDFNLAHVKLKDLRGKVIVLYSMTDGGNFSWMGQYVNDNDKKNFDMQDAKYLKYADRSPDNNGTLGYSGNRALEVYDRYSNAQIISQLLTDQNDKLNKFGGLGQNYLFLYSWTITGAFDLSLTQFNILKNTPQAHGYLPGELAKRYNSTNGGNPANINKMPNIVYIDAVDPTITQAIIHYNFIGHNPNKATAHDIPQLSGSFTKSCWIKNYDFRTKMITALCHGKDAALLSTTVRVEPGNSCVNLDGQLSCTKFSEPTGNWSNSCTRIGFENNFFTAWCKKANGEEKRAWQYIDTSGSECTNNNGNLECKNWASSAYTDDARRFLPGEFVVNNNNGDAKIYANDKSYYMVLQTDGNFVAYGSQTEKQHPIWAQGNGSAPNNERVTNVKFQDDGNLVGYNSTGKAMWNSGTSNKGAAYMDMQRDGNLVIYDHNHKALWSARDFNSPR